MRIAISCAIFLSAAALYASIGNCGLYTLVSFENKIKIMLHFGTKVTELPGNSRDEIPEWPRLWYIVRINLLSKMGGDRL